MLFGCRYTELRQNQPLFLFTAPSLILHQRKCPNSALCPLKFFFFHAPKEGKPSIDRNHIAVVIWPWCQIVACFSTPGPSFVPWIGSHTYFITGAQLCTHIFVFLLSIYKLYSAVESTEDRSTNDQLWIWAKCFWFREEIDVTEGFFCRSIFPWRCIHKSDDSLNQTARI